MLQQIYNIVDTMVVGQYVSFDALAAVGSAYTLMTFLNSVIIGLCMGSGALFYKSFGAGNRDEMKNDIRLSYMLAPNTSLGVNDILWSIPISWILADLVGAAKMWRDSRGKQL